MAIECPKCKGKVHVDKEIAKIFCMYCRTEIQVKKPSVVETTGENHEFKSKLAIATHYEKLYFSRDEKSFNQVMNAYDEARLIGAHHAEYWLMRARFYAKGKLHEFSKGRVQLNEQATIIDQYTLWMETALEHYDGLDAEILAEQNRMIAEIKDVFEKKLKEKEERKNQFLNEQASLERAREEAVKKKKPFVIAISVCVAVVLIVIVTRFNRAAEAERHETITSHLQQMTISNWDLEDTPYNNFLNLDYVIAFIADQPTRQEVQRLGLAMEPNTHNENELRTESGSREFNLAFLFDGTEPDAIISRVTMRNVRYFDGLALYQLENVRLYNIPYIFNMHYDVNARLQSMTVIFTYQAATFRVSRFSNNGVEIRIDAPN